MESDVVPAVVFATIAFFVGLAVGVKLMESYRVVDKCQHIGMSRSQCWCLEKRGWDSEGVRACFLEAPDDKR